MTKRRLLSLTTIAILGWTIISSCKKEGCTDEMAVNYAMEANKDNGSCIYEGQILFWFDNNTAIALQAAGIDSLRFHLDSLKFRTVHVNDGYSYIEPDCDNGVIKRQKTLGGLTTETATYYVQDQTGADVFTGSTAFTGGECTKINLIYP